MYVFFCVIIFILLFCILTNQREYFKSKEKIFKCKYDEEKEEMVYVPEKNEDGSMRYSPSTPKLKLSKTQINNCKCCKQVIVEYEKRTSALEKINKEIHKTHEENYKGLFENVNKIIKELNKSADVYSKSSKQTDNLNSELDKL